MHSSPRGDMHGHPPERDGGTYATKCLAHEGVDIYPYMYWPPPCKANSPAAAAGRRYRTCGDATTCPKATGKTKVLRNYYLVAGMPARPASCPSHQACRKNKLKPTIPRCAEGISTHAHKNTPGGSLPPPLSKCCIPSTGTGGQRQHAAPGGGACTLPYTSK